MFIVFGTHVFKKANVVQGHTQCMNCGVMSRTVSYDGRAWHHVNYIPLAPVGKLSRMLMECKYCKTCVRFELEDLPSFQDRVVDDVEDAAAALLAGQETFLPRDGSPEQHCGIYLANSVGMLYCLQLDDEVERIMDLLEKQRDEFNKSLMEGAQLEFDGDHQQADEVYGRILENNYSSIQWPVYLGQFYSRWNYREDAIEVFEEADERWPHVPVVLENLVFLYDQTKQYHDLCDTYEDLVEVAPGIRANKWYVQTYRKACKKARRRPVYD
ncbi:MAG: hypothetical protein ACFCD0_17205 [Gemmataceae bacterium]